MGEGVSDSNGFKKHMLAKRISEIPKNVIEKVPYWYGSRKIKIGGKDDSTQKSRTVHCVLSNIIIILE